MDDTHWPSLTEPLRITGDLVHVVRLDLKVEPDRIAMLRSVLSPDELVRADRYKFEEPRRRFIVCRAMLRQLLGACLGQEARSVTFEYGLHGKPGVVAPARVPRVSLEFSVSHSADLALIAISMGHRVGVDVEQRDAKVRILKLATRFFSPREAAQLAGLPESEQLAGFYQGWTGKEAYLKATGFGLSFPLSKFTVELNPCEPVRLCEVADQPDEAARWQMHSLNVAPDFSAALLIEAAADVAVAVKRWSLAVQVTDS